MKKMAVGGISGLGNMLTPEKPSLSGGGGGGGSAMEGLGTVNQGANAIGNALGRASAAIGGGGSGGTSPGNRPELQMKRGGKVTTTRRISTGQRSKKSSNW